MATAIAVTCNFNDLQKNVVYAIKRTPLSTKDLIANYVFDFVKWVFSFLGGCLKVQG